MPTHVTATYATVQSRIPLELLDAVQHYASQHRCSISALIREGLELRLETDVPGRGQGHASGEVLPLLHGLQHTLNALQNELPGLQRTLQRTIHSALREAVQDVLYDVLQGKIGEQAPTWRAENVLQNVLQAGAEQRDHAGTSDALRHVLHTEAREPDYGHTDPEGYDAATFYLGKLCPRGHEYPGTGQSLLRRRSQGCRECDNEAKRARRARQKATALAG
jgi:hypothetical protein